MRSSLLKLLRSGLAALALTLALGAAGVELKEGVNYQTLAQAQPTETPGKIEVSEFFWYGCPHCFALEPVLAKWLAALPVDVAFRRIPADFGRWTAGARLYYALVALGEESRLRGELFDAIHNGGLFHTKEADVSEWLAKRGVAPARFSAAYNSPAIADKLKQSQLLTKAHGLDGVPTLVVAGKYWTSSTLAGGHEGVPAVLDALIAKARAEQSRTK